jgi:hypothetical protein
MRKTLTLFAAAVLSLLSEREHQRIRHGFNEKLQENMCPVGADRQTQGLRGRTWR